MVFLVGGFLLTYGQARNWAKARGEIITGPTDAIPAGLRAWFRKKNWHAFYPLPTDYPRVRVEGGPKRKPVIMLVCRQADAVNSTIRHHPALKPRPHDMEIQEWLHKQGLKSAHWVTMPDPLCAENPNIRPQEGDGDEDGDMFENKHVYRGENLANSEPQGPSASGGRVDRSRPPTNPQPRVAPAPFSESPNQDGDSLNTGRVLRSGRCLALPAGRDRSGTGRRARSSKAETGKGRQQRASSRRVTKH